MSPTQFPELSVVPEGTVTSPVGFRAAGVHVGIKTEGLDLAVVFSEEPATAAGVFTTSVVRAAPVKVSMRRLQGESFRAVVANSGNANACTGLEGEADAERICMVAAEALGVGPEEVLVASTGIIGRRLPMPLLEQGIPQAVAALSPEGGHAAAAAILTTDTRPKECAVRLTVDGRPVTIGGIAKGAGMIAPHMATMLCFLTTDAAVDREALEVLLRDSVSRSFNSITVDGDTSTNDTVLALANGRAGNGPVAVGGTAYDRLTAAFRRVTRELALQLVRDGEGATRMAEVTVEEASSELEARRIALTVCNSLLVKTALFGGDPNWGRIAAAVGRSGAHVVPGRLRIWLGDVLVMHNGAATDFSLPAAEAAVREDPVTIRIAVGAGESCWTTWTCDLSYDYVRINAEYHT